MRQNRMPQRDVEGFEPTASPMTMTPTTAPRLAGWLGLAATAVLLPLGLGSLWRAAHLRDLALDLDPFEIDLQLHDRNDDEQ